MYQGVIVGSLVKEPTTMVVVGFFVVHTMTGPLLRGTSPRGSKNEVVHNLLLITISALISTMPFTCN